jgi:hypothetical protein
LTDFTNLAYLKEGNPRQQDAYRILTSSRVMEILADYHPVLTGTIPIGIHLPDSDLDIACFYKDREAFQATLIKAFGSMESYVLKIRQIRREESVIARFYLEGQKLEVFGQTRPVEKQASYLHMLIEHQILEKNGEEFRQQILALKRSGLKTEPAFARLLGLHGDPYLALLEYGKIG